MICDGLPFGILERNQRMGEYVTPNDKAFAA
jgi:hypothetical protein